MCLIIILVGLSLCTALIYACDYGMIFVRCKDGISHNPLEYASYKDLALGAEVLYGTVLEVLKVE